MGLHLQRAASELGGVSSLAGVGAGAAIASLLRDSAAYVLMSQHYAWEDLTLAWGLVGIPAACCWAGGVLSDRCPCAGSSSLKSPLLSAAAATARDDERSHIPVATSLQEVLPYQEDPAYNIGTTPQDAAPSPQQSPSPGGPSSASDLLDPPPIILHDSDSPATASDSQQDKTMKPTAALVTLFVCSLAMASTGVQSSRFETELAQHLCKREKQAGIWPGFDEFAKISPLMVAMA